MAALLFVALILGLAPLAFAERDSTRDPAGDTHPNVVAGADARGASASYGKKRLAVKVNVPKLGHRGYVEVNLDKPGDSTYPVVKYLKIRKTRKTLRLRFLRVYDYTGEVRRIKCRVRGSWSTDKGVVRISAPKKCVKWSRVKVKIWTYAPGPGSTYGFDGLKKMVLDYN